MKKLTVNLPHQHYPILIEKGLIHRMAAELKKTFKGQKIALITDGNLEKLYAKKVKEDLEIHNFQVKMIVVQPGEGSKSMVVLQEIYEELLDFAITRADLIVTLGGGVVGDVGGFAASTYLRGISFIQIPTSLLAQIDSSIGGKVAVNLPRGKNLIGSFYQPQAVFIDPELLTTLDKRYLYDGMAEVIKYGCIADKSLFESLEEFLTEKELFEHLEEIIYKCCSIKKEIVQRDERDTGERMLLNFGHTLGHVIEKYFHYEYSTHGEAVAMGMYSITQKSEGLGVTKKGTAQRMKEILQKYHLPYEMPPINPEEILQSIGVDKKNKGNYIHIILLEEIGKGFIKKINREEVGKYI